MSIVYIKVVVLGNSETGKSTLINRLVTGTYTPNLTSTVGVNFLPMDLPAFDERVKEAIKILFWDFSGKERFSFLMRLLRGTVAALLVFSVVDKSSFTAIKHSWLPYIYRYYAINSRKKDVEKPYILLVANKIDLGYKMSKEHFERFVLKYGIDFVETSAKTGQGIEDIENKIFTYVKSFVTKTLQKKIHSYA